MTTETRTQRELRRLRGVARRVLALTLSAEDFEAELALLQADAKKALEDGKVAKGQYMAEFGDKMRRQSVECRKQAASARYKIVLQEIAEIERMAHKRLGNDKLARAMTRRGLVSPFRAFEWSEEVIRRIRKLKFEERRELAN